MQAQVFVVGSEIKSPSTTPDYQFRRRGLQKHGTGGRASSTRIAKMASRRSLGGGRVLGNGKNLAPPPPPRPVQAVRSPAVLSPSESSLSLSSLTSSTPLSIDNEDLTSRIALDEHGVAQAAAAASSRMVCPICSEEMVCLYGMDDVVLVLTWLDDATSAQ